MTTPPPDPLSDVLRVLRVGGSLVLDDTYSHPWAVDVPAADRLAELAHLDRGRVVAFHLVRQGCMRVESEDGRVVDAGAGDLVVCFGGLSHQLSAGDGATPVPLERLVGRTLAKPTVGPTTSIICGAFSLDDIDVTPLTNALPDVVHVRGGVDADFDILGHLLITEIAADRAGRDFTTSRIIELICAEALRQVARTIPSDRPNWLRALNDPAIAATMSAIHADPGHAWDVEGLAREAALSPSRLSARFRQTIGHSPMAYVTSWRMVVAARLLTDTQATVQSIAERVGYTAQPSFTRSFTRHYAMSPRSYRKLSSSAGANGRKPTR